MRYFLIILQNCLDMKLCFGGHRNQPTMIKNIKHKSPHSSSNTLPSPSHTALLYHSQIIVWPIQRKPLIASLTFPCIHFMLLPVCLDPIQAQIELKKSHRARLPHDSLFFLCLSSPSNLFPRQPAPL